MRYLIAMMLLVSAHAASATDYVYSRMNGNAILVLTPDVDKCLFGKSGYLFSMTGVVLLTNCWELEGEEVRVSYSDGTQRMYPKTMFLPRNKEDKATY